MAFAWIKSAYPGVRYREHPERKQRNGQPDRYYTVRCRVKGKLQEEALGWATEGWNPEKAHKILSRIKEGLKLGEGPASLAEMQREGERRREEEAAAARREAVGMISLDDFFDEYFIPLIKREKRSWKTDEKRIKNIRPEIGGLPMRVIGTGEIQAFLDARAKTDAPATVKHYMALLRRAFNVAMATMVEGVPLFSGENPATGKKLTLPKVLNERSRFLSGEEADDLVDAAFKSGNVDLHDAIVLSLNTGLRLGELLRLEWADVDLAHGFVTVRDEDMRKPGGTVPLNADAAAVFKRRFKARHDGAKALRVFPPLRGRERDISHQFKDLVDTTALNSGVPEDDRKRRVVFHTLRHTFASWLALKGTDIYRIKTLMRHKTITMTMRYAHLIPDATRNAVHNLKPPKKK